jgi:hypothetical protein
VVDNTQLNSGTGGDNVRDIDRGTAKTQVVQLDAGGQLVESLVSAANPLPVAFNPVIAAALLSFESYNRLNSMFLLQTLQSQQAAAQNGFFPMETPNFLLGTSG